MANFSNLFGTPALDPSIKQSTTSYNYDPTAQFISKLIGDKYASGQGTVAPEVMGGINQLITNPGAIGDIAGKQFADISKPLVDAAQYGYKNEQNTLRDTLRKNGALQSGASAYETRRLLENQGNRTNQMLAASYIPLTQQLSNNVIGGVGAGLKVPGANMDSLASILAAYGRMPLSQSTTQTGESGSGTLSSGSRYTGSAPVDDSWLMGGSQLLNAGSWNQHYGSGDTLQNAGSWNQHY